MGNYFICESDKAILRETAKKQLQFAMEEVNQERIKEWYLHNSLQGKRPMIHLETDTFAKEIIPQRLKCTGEFARQIESELHMNFVNQELFDDDWVTPDYFQIHYDTWFHLFGLQDKKEQAIGADGKESVGYHFVSTVEDLEDDYDKLKESQFGVNRESTEERRLAVEEAIGDILPVRAELGTLYCVPTQRIVHFMSMENMMYAMYDYPELFQEMMNRIADDMLAYFRFLEEQRILTPTTAFQNVGQGTKAFNHELPNWDEWKKRPFTTKDIWGFMDSQESVGISPQMFEEFIFPCYQKIAGEFGLLSYGCCEPVDPIWESCISKLDNLRKVSISPWCNEEIMGERLRGSSVIFHRKPSPNYLGVDRVLDEEAFRAHIRKSILAANGCSMEITQRDVYTIHNDVEKARRYVEIIREELANNWK